MNGMASIKGEVAQLLKSRGDIDRQILRRQLALLKSLPESMGYETIDDLIQALTPLASSVMRGRLEASDVATAQPAKRPRKYDGQVRARVRHAIESMRETVASVSRAEGISVPTIMKWKREWGLTGTVQKVERQAGHPAECA